MRKRLFKHWGFKLPLLLGILMVSMILASGVALAVSSVPSISSGSISGFTGNYYAFPIPHPDLWINSGSNQPAYGIVKGLVNDTLTSANSYLPTLTPSGQLKINQFDWWSGKPIFSRDDGNLTGIPTTSFFPVRGAGNPAPPTGVTLLPTIPTGTVVNNKTGDECNLDYNGYTAVHWTATLTVTNAGTFGFNIDSDDDAWLFVNHQLVVDDGWIHDFASGTASGTITLQPGTYTIDIFYADRCTVDAGFSFSAVIPSHAGTESFPILSATPSYFEQFGS